jgi:hypothetical protein
LFYQPEQIAAIESRSTEKALPHLRLMVLQLSGAKTADVELGKGNKEFFRHPRL